MRLNTEYGLRERATLTRETGTETETEAETETETEKGPRALSRVGHLSALHVCVCVCANVRNCDGVMLLSKGTSSFGP